MRIIAGRYKRRRLHTPSDASTTRPLPDRVRESLFNLLRGHFEDAVVFDGFAGTGSFGLEAASRGARRVIFVEQDRRVARLLERNIRELDPAGELPHKTELIVGDALGPGCLVRTPRPLHLALLDPPYPLVKHLAGWERVRAQAGRLVAMLDAEGYAIVRTPWPFWHRADSRGSDGEQQAADRHRHRVGPRASRRTDQDPEPDDAPPDESVPEADRLPADLAIQGAAGPETHAYKNTAVHLYMRADADP